MVSVLYSISLLLIVYLFHASIAVNMFHMNQVFNTSHTRRHVGVPLKYSLEKLWNISNRQSYIIDTWKVPYAWINPSITRHPNNSNVAIMIYRIPDPKKKDKIGHLQFEMGFKVIVKKPDMLELLGPNTSRTMMYGEDARIFLTNNRLHLAYNTHLNRSPKKFLYAEVKHSTAMDNFYVDFPPNHVNIEHEAGVRHQKNWAPFDYNHPSRIRAELFFVYSIVPHRIVKAYPTTVEGELKGESICLTQLENEYEWQWGELRGGSPAVLVGDEYMVFFHSSGSFNGKGIISYFMGAYTFQREPPFAITKISPEPIVAKAFINESISGWAYRKTDYVIFAMGFIDDPANNSIFVSYGKNDRESWVLHLNRSSFLSSLKPVRSILFGDSQWEKGSPVPGSFKLTDVGVAGLEASAKAAASFAAELAAEEAAALAAEKAEKGKRHKS